MYSKTILLEMVKEIIDELYECKQVLESNDPLDTCWENKIVDCYRTIKVD